MLEHDPRLNPGMSDEESVQGSNMAAAEDSSQSSPSSTAPEEEVHELFRVYMSRDEVPADGKKIEASVSSEHTMPRPNDDEAAERVCVSQSGYYALLSAITVLVTLILIMGVVGSKVLHISRSKHLVY